MITTPAYDVAVLTSTRADWGLLAPLCRALQSYPSITLRVIATNMHLVEALGNTLEEIRADGYDPEVLPCEGLGDDTPDGALAMMASIMQRLPALLASRRPDMVIILGDRFEMLAAATACMMHGIRICHIAGGETSLGAIDDAVRHSITHMASLHLTAAEQYRRRVISLGADPRWAINIGSLGIYNLEHLEPYPKAQLDEEVGMVLDGDTLLVTMHPATRDTADISYRADQLLAALDRTPYKLLFTAPNNDPGGDCLRRHIIDYVAAHHDRAAYIPSLGARRYHTALQYVGAVVGNSSSGIVEVPSAGIPTVDIGIRQLGRLAAPSVIHCEAETDAILEAIRLAFNPEMRQLAARKENPYYQPNPPARAAKAISHYLQQCPALLS